MAMRSHPGHDHPTRAAALLEVPLRFCFQRETEEIPVGPGLPEDPPDTVQEVFGAMVHTVHGTAMLTLEVCPSPDAETSEVPLPAVAAAPGMTPHQIGTEPRLRIAPLEAGALDAVYYVDLQPFLAQLATQFLQTRQPPVALVR